MADNTDIGITVEAWADITVKNWLDRIIALKVIDTRNLFNSFSFFVTKSANGDPQKVEFAFSYYGKFVDMGVGNGNGLNDANRTRHAKRWYNKTFGNEITKLRFILAEKYAQNAVFAVIDSLDDE